MQYLVTAGLMILFLVIVEPHPMCLETVDHQNSTTVEPACYTNVTANETFLNEWLSLHDKSEGINQLRRRKDSSIVSILLNLTAEMVIIKVIYNYMIIRF